MPLSWQNFIEIRFIKKFASYVMAPPQKKKIVNVRMEETQKGKVSQVFSNIVGFLKTTFSVISGLQPRPPMYDPNSKYSRTYAIASKRGDIFLNPGTLTEFTFFVCLVLCVSDLFWTSQRIVLSSQYWSI